MHSFSSISPSYYYPSHSPPSPPSPSSYQYPSPMSGVQGQLLEVTVVGCNKLKDTEWISRQDPYVCLEYGSSKSRTRTCTDGGKNPTFQEKFVFTLIEGLREMLIVVWNSNTITRDDFIGSGRAQLQKVISEGYDDSTWPIQTKTGRHAGEVRLIMHYPNAKKPGKVAAPSAPHYAASHPPVSMYPTPGPPAPYPSPYGPPTTAYSGTSSYPPNPAYPPNTAYPPPSTYPSPSPAAYPPSPYPPSSAYPPSPYPPPSAYPPPAYPPPPQSSPYYPPPQGPYPGYPPPPY